MSHSHSHDRTAYYVEQLCMIGICGLLGGVSVMLYYQNLLFYIATNRRINVLLAGIVLLVLVVLRAITLWSSVGRESPIPIHDLEHENDHALCHDHGPECADDGHDHDDEHHHHHHDHEHDHNHEHDHGDAHGHAADHGHDHEHSWNPVRYIVLLLPIVLYFLNLPNSGFTSGFSRVRTGDLETTVEDVRYVENTGLQIAKAGTGGLIQVAKVVGESPAERAGIQPRDLIAQVTRWEDSEGKKLKTSAVISMKGKSIEEAVKELRGKPDTKISLSILHEGDEKPADIELVLAADVYPLPFKALDGVAYDPGRRRFYDGRLVKLTGQFAPGSNDQVFGLVRYKMTCCAADAQPLNVVIMLDPKSKESVSGMKPNQWVEVMGRIQFRKRRDRDEYVTVLLIASAKDVRSVKPDPEPFIQ